MRILRSSKQCAFIYYVVEQHIQKNQQSIEIAGFSVYTNDFTFLEKYKRRISSAFAMHKRMRMEQAKALPFGDICPEDVCAMMAYEALRRYYEGKEPEYSGLENRQLDPRLDNRSRMCYC